MTFSQIKDLVMEYDRQHALGLATKHHTHDSTIYIIQSSNGFRAFKFYDDGVDYRISSYSPCPAMAYSEAVVIL